jgi:hypothetical protein
MKKISMFLAVLAIGFASAKELPAVGINGKDVCQLDKELVSIIDDQKFNSEGEETLVTITCSTTIDTGFGTTLTVSTSAGNWFTSAETAAINCTKKLQHKLIDLMYDL